MTYREIAEECGCSYQNVAKALASRNVVRFRHFTENACVYPALRKWLNDNRVSIEELLRRVYGHNIGGTTRKRYTDVFRGHAELKKRDIDNLLRVTGMTYEELFREGE